jgi:hypothetical protein
MRESFDIVENEHVSVSVWEFVEDLQDLFFGCGVG